MKRFILVLSLFSLFAGCKKSVETKAENAIVKAMTDGQWIITSFTSDTSDITSDFAGYKFQYFSNYTVDAIKNGSVENTGVWVGDVSSMSISAKFSGAGNPLLLINGTWMIKDNSWTYVKATMNIGNEIRTLRLDKQ